MIALTEKTTMLYCPKCRRTYEQGTQRFCDDDGGRLLPAPSPQKSDAQTNGVFSNLLGKTQNSNDADNKNESAPRYIPVNKTEESDKKLTSFPSGGRIFQSEQFLKPKTKKRAESEDSILELEPLPKSQEDDLLELDLTQMFDETPIVVETPLSRISFDETPLPPDFNFTDIEPPKPAPRVIKFNEIPSGTGSVGNRRTNPLGRAALSWENPDALIGQTVKGRYQVSEEMIADDEDSLIYLAEDKIVAGKKVVVRVFMDGDLLEAEPEKKVFAEERVSLSHLNHPNIAGIFDSGELPEGNDFIVSEFVEGKTLAEMLKNEGEFNALRTARIVRQTSYALSEAHQNGILHRNLKPENIVLTVSETGIEQVKLMNFGVSRGEITDSNFLYKAPEEIVDGTSTFASDIYALGVIAYQMLTARLPFESATESGLVKLQKKGLKNSPTTLRQDVQPLTGKILEKTLAFNPSARYPKARDFGDAFFNALTTVVPSWTHEEAKVETPEITPEKKRGMFVVPPIKPKEDLFADSPIEADIHISPRPQLEKTAETAEIADVKATEDLAWEKRSPDLPQTGSSWRGWLAIAGVVALLIAFWGISRLFINRANQPAEVVQPQPNPNENAVVPSSEITPDNSLTSGEPDIAPEPRLQKTPPAAQRFQNNRDDLKEGLAKNFLGFEIFYPQGWTKNASDTNFLDISKRSASGFPIEQMLITRYDSRGTMTLDRPNFPKLVEKSNQDLKKSLGDSFKVVSEGDTVIQNGRWKVYEVKFQSTGKNEKGDTITLWGRRLWLPVQRAGVQSGFVITLLATSLSDSIKSVDDVGIKGELANVLETFEPEQR